MKTERKSKLIVNDITVEEYAALRSAVAVMLREYVMDKKPYADIASSHDVPLGTVKSRLNRARLHIAARREFLASQTKQAAA